MTATGSRTERGFRGNLSDADIRLLKVFRAVVDAGGFSAAEVTLGKSKSAISLDISHLEKRLGARLCTRGPRGFALTREGHAIHHAAIQLGTDLERFRDRVGAALGEISGRVSLFLVDNIVSIAEAPLVRALAEFGRAHPRVLVRVESATPSGVERAVLEGEADLGISVVPRPMDSLEMIPLFREELRLYCGRGHPLFDRAPEELVADAVMQHALVRPSVTEEPAARDLMTGFPVSGEASNLDARILLVLSGLHLVFLPPHYAGTWLARGDIREIRPDLFASTNTFHLQTKKSVRQTAAADRLMQTILRAFRASATGLPLAGG